MTLHQVLASIYKEIVKAQYDAYDYSRGLREQAADSLFPIPVVKATDISLTVNYADMGMIPNTEIDRLNIPLFKSALSKETQHSIEEGIQVFLRYVETNHKVQPEEIPLLKNSLASGKLATYLVEQIMQKIGDKHQLITKDGVFNEETYCSTVNLCFQNEVLRHRDIQTLTVGDRELLLRKLDVIIQNSLPQIQASFLANMEKEEGTQQITIDADQLKTLPKETIQQLTLRMKVDELLDIAITD